MSLENRISALEAKRKPNRLLVVWANRGETVEDVMRRENIGPNDPVIFLVVNYDETPLETPVNA